MEVCNICIQRYTAEEIQRITQMLNERNDKFYCIHKYDQHIIYLQQKNNTNPK